mgnify:CR=1 FL=1
MTTLMFQVLGLDSTASQNDMNGAYKQLATQWHLDRAKDPTPNWIAEAEFIEIKTAYSTLSAIKQYRSEEKKEGWP